MPSDDNGLCPSQSDLCGLAGDDGLTQYGELAIARTPVITEESVKVDDFVCLSVLCPK